MSSTALPLVATAMAAILNDSLLALNSSSGNGTDVTTASNNGRQFNLNDYALFRAMVAMDSYHLWVIFALGVPGNLASIYTIITMPTVSSSKAHVAILALADTIAIVLKLSYQQISLHGTKLTAPGCTIMLFMQQFFTTYVNWIVVAMTMERFVAVWFPLRVGRIYTRKMALGVLAGFAAITGCVNLVLFWSWTETYYPNYGYACQITSEMRNFIVKTFYWIEALYNSMLPCIFVLMGNVLIITNIRRARRAQRRLTNSCDQGRKSRDQRQITVMLLVVSTCFLLLNMPNAICYLIKIRLEVDKGTYEYLQYKFLFRFVNICTNTNHAVNFYLYFLSMATFRRRFLDAIRCKKSVRRRPTGSVYRTSQTYVQSAQLSETSRTEMPSARYINVHTLNRNGSNAESHHSLKSCSSGGNNARLSIHTDNSSHVTANSEV